MKVRASTAAVASFAATGFIVAGCSSSSSSPTASAATSSATSGALSSTSAQAGAKPASPAAPQPKQASGTATCQAAGLSYALGTVTGTSQRTQVVDLTNKGSSACTLQGFPGVNLSGAANGRQNYTWPLARQSAAYSAVTLRPGQTAHFSLIYLPGASDSSNMTVSKLIITPPNAYTQAEITWNQSVLLQDGATHPGTYITPVVAGS